MYVFHGKHDHSGRRRGRRSYDDDLPDRPPRQIPDVNHWTVPLGEHGRIERWLLLLRVFTDRSLERKRIYRIVQVFVIISHGAEIVAHLHTLVRSNVKVNFLARSYY